MGIKKKVRRKTRANWRDKENMHLFNASTFA